MPGLAAIALFAAALPNAVVLQPVANMYSKPSLEADVVSQAIYGANVAVLPERAERWALVRTGDDYTGWMPLDHLRITQPYAVRGVVAEVASLFAHIYREPSVTKHARLLTAPFETRLEVVPEAPNGARYLGGAGDSPALAASAGESPAPPESRWVRVRLPDDRAGWVQAGDLDFERKPLTVAGMLDLSKRFLGLPYTWGGTSSFGYDCSGFMQMVNRRRGVGLPRDAQPQADWNGSVAVKQEDLQAGDLLYFGSSPQRINHTGMYLGEGKFINATTYRTPAVRIDDLADPHWAGLLVAIRRVK